jgi:mannosylglycerate hydrolase
MLEPLTSLVTIEPTQLLLSALKPAEAGEGLVVRVLNPTDEPIDARIALGLDASKAEIVRLDETPTSVEVQLDGRTLRFAAPPRALVSVLID